jgi:rhodanese-related sulfurtransferase
MSTKSAIATQFANAMHSSKSRQQLNRVQRQTQFKVNNMAELCNDDECVDMEEEDLSPEAKQALVKVQDVKDTLGRGFILVDIRSPQEVAKTGSKFSWEKFPIAMMDEAGNPLSNPNFLALIKKKFPNSMSRILLACDDGTFRSDLAHRLITTKLKYANVKIIEGGINAYIKHQPLTKEDLVKVRMVAQAGSDLSTLVSGVDTRQAGQKFY